MPIEEREPEIDLKAAMFSQDKSDVPILRLQSRKERIREFVEVLAGNPAFRMTLFICGALVPFVSFFMSASGTHWGGTEPWQSGSMSIYAGLLLGWPVAAAFYPVLAYSMVCLATWVFDPPRFGKKYWVRLGVYFGVAWSIAFSYLAYIDSSSLLGTIFICAMMYFGASVGFSIIWGIAWLVVRGYQSHWWLFVTCSIVSAVILVGASLVLGIFGPPLAFISYSIAAISIWMAKERSFQFSIAKLLGTTAYLAGIFASWRLAIDLMLIEYSKLPTENPNCFVSAAAANGHRRWVGSETNICNGNTVCVNHQMRVLKAGEFILAVVAPAAHRRIRRFYNRVGPPLAVLLGRSKFAADVTFVALLPVQLVFYFSLRLLRIDRQNISSLYRI